MATTAPPLGAARERVTRHPVEFGVTMLVGSHTSEDSVTGGVAGCRVTVAVRVPFNVPVTVAVVAAVTAAAEAVNAVLIWPAGTTTDGGTASEGLLL
jgi:hypothetical protein